MTRRPAIGYVMILLAAVLFAVNGSISKVALTSGLEPERLTAIRVTGAFLVLFAVALLRDAPALKVTRRELPVLAVYGLIGVALIQYFYFVAILRLPVGIALLLEFTGPVFVALYSRVVLREPIRRRVWLALGLSLAGLALIVQVWRGGGGLDPIGLLAGMGAALALAFYYLAGQRLVRGRDPLSLTTWAFFFAAIFWAVFQPWWGFDAGSLAADAALPHGNVPVGLLVISIIVMGTTAPFLLALAALQHVSATRAGIVATAEPVIASAVSWMWLGEALTLVQMAGGLLVVTGVILVQTARDGAQPARHPADGGRDTARARALSVGGAVTDAAG